MYAVRHWVGWVCSESTSKFGCVSPAVVVKYQASLNTSHFLSLSVKSRVAVIIFKFPSVPICCIVSPVAGHRFVSSTGQQLHRRSRATASCNIYDHSFRPSPVCRCIKHVNSVASSTTAGAGFGRKTVSVHHCWLRATSFICIRRVAYYCWPSLWVVVVHQHSNQLPLFIRHIWFIVSLVIALSPFSGVQRADLFSPVAGHRFNPSFKQLFPAHRQLASNISAKHV